MNENNILKAIDEIKKGKFVIIKDSKDRENEGDLVISALLIDSKKMNFLFKKARGLICAPISEEIKERLNLNLIEKNNVVLNRSNFLVSLDYKDVTSGISSFDRALTANKLASEETLNKDFLIPGHLFPLLAKKNLLLEREGHTEASIELMKLASLPLCAICCELLNNDGTNMNKEELLKFSKKYNILYIEIDELKKFIYKN